MNSMATIQIAGTRLLIETSELQAAIQTQGYVTGVAEGSFIDRKTGARDPGFGLLIADFLLEPGPDRPATPPDLRYDCGNPWHGDIAKRYVALPQICIQAGSLPYEITTGDGFVEVRQWFEWNIACPPYPAGARWEQRLRFQDGQRWFLAWDRFAPAADAPAVMMRLDMPCHIRHHAFQQLYLSYHGLIAREEFEHNFAPDARFLYQRDDAHLPQRFIRAIQLPNGVWLAGMALEPALVSEAWCHQRDYVCLIQEFGGRAVRAGEWTEAAHLVGYFDSIAEMEQTYDAQAQDIKLRDSS